MPVGIEFLGWATFRFVTERGTKILMVPFGEDDTSYGIQGKECLEGYLK